MILCYQLANPKEPAHEVTHFHYTAWPDHGVPSDATSLINFIKRVREAQPHSTEVPLLVHCSAGVGRTGTFIAIDIEMQRIEAEGVVDVYGCLKKLRTHRILMVQTLVSICIWVQEGKFLYGPDTCFKGTVCINTYYNTILQFDVLGNILGW